MSEPKEPVQQRQRALNQTTAHAWDAYASHRARVMQLLTDGVGGRLAVLGAGNCNDLELPRLRERFEQITLVDCDEVSLRDGVARQCPEPLRAVELCAPVDLAAPVTPERAVEEAQHDAVAAAERAARRISPVGYDVVVSSCLLTQLVLGLIERVGPQHPRCVELVQFERAVHLHTLVELANPAGRVLLVSDLVSTDSAPELATSSPEQLPKAMFELVKRGNFFTGMNPFLIEHWLKTDPTIAPRVSGVELLTPWLWNVGPRRSYLAFAVRCQRAA